MSATTKQLQEAIRDNMVDYFKEIGKANTDIEFQNDEFIARYLIGIPHPFFNRVLRTSGSFHNRAEERVRETLDRYKSKSLPCLWLEWLVDDQPRLAPVLEQHGFQKFDSMPGMALDLRGWNGEYETIPGLEVKRVSNETEFALMGDLLRAAFGFSEIAGDAFLRFVGNVGFAEESPTQHYIGWLDGRPVACVTSFLHDGILGIYNVATAEDVRGRGIGFATTVHPILLEREKGCETAILHATKLGHGVYKRIGFKDYVQIDMYLNM